MKRCKDCGKMLPFDLFYRNEGMRDGRLSWCKGCNAARYGQGRAARAKRDRLYFQTIKVEQGCTDCGYAAHPAALEFDHLPGTVKRYRIATMAGMRRELIDAEIAKCEVVCANCHRIRTAERLEVADGDEAKGRSRPDRASEEARRGGGEGPRRREAGCDRQRRVQPEDRTGLAIGA